MEGKREEPVATVLPLDALSDEQKGQIVSSEDFAAFVERSARVMERALADTSDILFDFVTDRDEEMER